MKSNLVRAGLVALGLAGAVSTAVAQGPGYGPGYGPGGGYGRGSGMMGGYGYGPGMMRGYGRGLAGLDLSSEQRQKIAAIQEANRSKNWNTMGQLRSEQFKLEQMYNADKVDSNAVAEQQKKVDELRRQLLKSRIDARNEVVAVLNPEQRKNLRQFGPWWLRDEEGGE
ncbi:MAG TPA: Spy/CpxP family protein refolding chaperone [Burkholderiales bacterium]|nr:Spy/CpxP family protein refolding chaperone [Burkholderiales bacterium]